MSQSEIEFLTIEHQIINKQADNLVTYELLINSYEPQATLYHFMDCYETFEKTGWKAIESSQILSAKNIEINTKNYRCIQCVRYIWHSTLVASTNIWMRMLFKICFSLDSRHTFIGLNSWSKFKSDESMFCATYQIIWKHTSISI